MRALVLEKFNGALHLRDMPQPVPEDGEVLVKVAYAGVNPVDWKIREGYLKDRIPHEFPLILGWDVAGTVVSIGKNVHGFSVGDEVFSYVRKPIVKWGAYAEFVVFEAKHVVKKPKNLTLKEAGALPLVSLTAWQSLFDAGKLKKAESILIQGGSGGVGSMAIQFAKNIGARVFATASPQKHDYIKELGADVAIDYKEDVAAHIKSIMKAGVDVVFDCVGGDAFTKSISCLKNGGRIVSILSHMDPHDSKKHGIKAEYVFVSPSGKDLTSIAKLIEQGKVKPPHIEEMMLEDAEIAHEKLRSGHVFGKIVLKV